MIDLDLAENWEFPLILIEVWAKISLMKSFSVWKWWQSLLSLQAHVTKEALMMVCRVSLAFLRISFHIKIQLTLMILNKLCIFCMIMFMWKNYGGTTFLTTLWPLKMAFKSMQKNNFKTCYYLKSNASPIIIKHNRIFT